MTIHVQPAAAILPFSYDRSPKRAHYRADRAYFLAAARECRASGNVEAARDEADEMRILRAWYYRSEPQAGRDYFDDAAGCYVLPIGLARLVLTRGMASGALIPLDDEARAFAASVVPADDSDASMKMRAVRQAIRETRQRVMRKARRERIAAKEAFLRSAR